MNSKSETKYIRFPEINSNTIFIAFCKHLDNLHREITNEINLAANSDISEIKRIERAYEWYFYNKRGELESAGFEIIELTIIPDNKEASTSECQLSLALIACSMAYEAIDNGDLEDAFLCQSNAAGYLGIARGVNNLESKRRMLLQAAAHKRYVENHAIKADALKYYAENIDSFNSKDSAAEQIAGKIVNAKFRTVRQWITDYHKKQRSAGTA